LTSLIKTLHSSLSWAVLSMYVCMYVCMYKCMYVYIYVSMYVCKYVYVCTMYCDVFTQTVVKQRLRKQISTEKLFSIRSASRTLLRNAEVNTLQYI
jgi:hypothetical protein